MEQEVILTKGSQLVHGKYCVCHKLATGQFSNVYSIGMQKKGKHVVRAIKVESFKSPVQSIRTQISVINHLKLLFPNQTGFALTYQMASQNDYYYIVSQLLGPNLQQLMRLSGGKFSMKTTLIVGLQILDRIQTIHSAGLVYKDIRPQNFTMGLQGKSQIVYMIDFGKCKRYKIKDSNKHIPYKQRVKMETESIFASLNAHNGIQYSRRDDIQAFIYLLIYLRKGKLPWMSSRQFKTKKEKQQSIEELKKKVLIQQLTFKMPMTFSDMLYYARSLNFYQKPDYDYLRTLLHRSFIQEQQNLSILFDWNNIDNLDFAIYNGQPKIVLKSDPRKQEDEDQQSKHSIQKGISIDVDLQSNKKGQILQKNKPDQIIQQEPFIEKQNIF